MMLWFLERWHASPPRPSGPWDIVQKEPLMDSPALSPEETVLWHLSVALYHLRAVIDNLDIDQILTHAECDALTQGADAIRDVMEALHAG